MEAQSHPIMVHRDHWTPEHMALLCGIANAGGGTLVVESTSKVFGPGRRKMRRPFEQIPQLVEKELGIDCSTEPVLDGSVLCLEINVPAAQSPISYEGVYWLFIDDYNTRSTRKAVQAVINGETPSTSRNTESWELQPQPDARLGGLNTEAFLALVTLKAESPNIATDSIAGTLMRRMSEMGLVGRQNDILTNASVLLLHNDPKKFIPGAEVKLRLMSQDGRELLSNVVGGALVHQLNETLRLLFEQYLPMGMVSAGSIEDDRTFALNLPPRDAVRDTLLLALTHKNYVQGAPIQVEVNPEQLTIMHPIDTLTGDDEGLAGTNETDAPLAPAANPLLARALQTLGIADEADLHHEAIINKCRAAGLAAPAFEQHQDGARTVFTLNSAEKQLLSAPPGRVSHDFAGDQASQSQQAGALVGLAGAITKDTPFSARSIAAANELDLTSTDEYVLRVLHSNGRATAVRIATVLGVSESTVRRAFRKLRKHGIIERVGSDKAGYWRVNV